MASQHHRRPLPYSAGLYCYLISLAVVAGATVGACYASAFILLRQPAKGPSTAAPIHDPGGGAVVLSRIAAANGAVSRVGREGTASAPRGRPALQVSGGGPSRAKTLSRLPTIARTKSVTPRPAAMLPLQPVTGEKLQAASRLSDAEVAALTARGDDMLRIRDIASARLYYERAADAGSGQAAFRMAAILDPAFLSQIGAQSVAGDPTRARYWYRRARELGASENPSPFSGGASN